MSVRPIRSSPLGCLLSLVMFRSSLLNCQASKVKANHCQCLNCQLLKKIKDCQLSPLMKVYLAQVQVWSFPFPFQRKAVILCLTNVSQETIAVIVTSVKQNTMVVMGTAVTAIWRHHHGKRAFWMIHLKCIGQTNLCGILTQHVIFAQCVMGPIPRTVMTKKT